MSDIPQDGNIGELLNLLDLEKLEDNLFRGQSQNIGGHSVFGGQVVAQALAAAYQTLGDTKNAQGEPEPRYAHSLHSYFLRPGDMEAPIVYEIDRIRDGGSFTTRRVVAIQHGEAIFNLSCSFQDVEQGFEHQSYTIPNVPDANAVESELAIRERLIDKVPEHYRALFLRENPILIHPVDPPHFFNPQPREARYQIWFKTNGAVCDRYDTLSQHQALLAYASDFYLLGCGILPHGYTFFTPQIQAASLDHAIWFHRPFRTDEWLLYDMESPSASASRALNRGLIYNTQGEHVASVVQESLVRLRR